MVAMPPIATVNRQNLGLELSNHPFERGDFQPVERDQQRTSISEITRYLTSQMAAIAESTRVTKADISNVG
jgi:hypothetical protein